VVDLCRCGVAYRKEIGVTAVSLLDIGDKMLAPVARVDGGWGVAEWSPEGDGSILARRPAAAVERGVKSIWILSQHNPTRLAEGNSYPYCFSKQSEKAVAASSESCTPLFDPEHVWRAAISFLHAAPTGYIPLAILGRNADSWAHIHQRDPGW